MAKKQSKVEKIESANLEQDLSENIAEQTPAQSEQDAPILEQALEEENLAEQALAESVLPLEELPEAGDESEIGSVETHESGEQEETSCEQHEAVDGQVDESDDASAQVAGEQNDNKKKKHKRRKIHEITLENDIRYRGPFSYRWLRIFAWVAIIAAQSAVILSLGIKIDANLARKYTGLAGFLQVVGTLSVPLFLMANFAIIINAKNGYKKLIAGYAFMVLVIFALFMLIYQRYLLGIIKMVSDGSEQSPQESFQAIFQLFSSSGFLSFNIFVDLLLCTLFTFFVNYNPKKVFVGKKVIIFRLFAILPVLYEIASFILKALCVLKDGFILPLYVSPFLTTKSPLTFVVFVALAFFIKNRERVFLKRGKTDEEYAAFLNTNLNSLHFSIAASICMAVAAIIDIILYFAIGVALTPASEDPEVIAQGITIGLNAANEIGFGKSVSLLLVIPFLLLFSYTRTHKPSSIDMLIPNIGMMAFALCYVEGLYQFILRLPQLLGGMMN